MRPPPLAVERPSRVHHARDGIDAEGGERVGRALQRVREGVVRRRVGVGGPHAPHLCAGRLVLERGERVGDGVEDGRLVVDVDDAEEDGGGGAARRRPVVRGDDEELVRVLLLVVERPHDGDVARVVVHHQPAAGAAHQRVDDARVVAVVGVRRAHAQHDAGAVLGHARLVRVVGEARRVVVLVEDRHADLLGGDERRPAAVAACQRDRVARLALPVERSRRHDLVLGRRDALEPEVARGQSAVHGAVVAAVAVFDQHLRHVRAAGRRLRQLDAARRRQRVDADRRPVVVDVAHAHRQRGGGGARAAAAGAGVRRRHEQRVAALSLEVERPPHTHVARRRVDAEPVAVVTRGARLPRVRHAPVVAGVDVGGADTRDDRLRRHVLVDLRHTKILKQMQIYAYTIIM